VPRLPKPGAWQKDQYDVACGDPIPHQATVSFAGMGTGRVYGDGQEVLLVSMSADGTWTVTGRGRRHGHEKP
jgi:hypothetical protein